MGPDVTLSHLMQRVAAMVTLGVVLAITSPAFAHVSASVNDNNRYLKVTPAADRIRIAYTVFYGEVPGRLLRPSLDTNHDGQITDAEASITATTVATDVAASLELIVDGKPRPVVWSTSVVGLGTPAVTGGAVSVDLVAWICLPTPGGAHHVRLRDRYRVPNPGETEVKIEDGLGITIDRTRIGTAEDSGHDYKFLGPGGPLLDDGLDLAFTADANAPRGDATCVEATPKRGHIPAIFIVLAGAVIGALIAAYAARRSRRA